MEAGKLLSIRQIARRWKVSYSLVRKWIVQGRLVPIDLDGRHYLPKSTQRPEPLDKGGLDGRGHDNWPK